MLHTQKGGSHITKTKKTILIVTVITLLLAISIGAYAATTYTTPAEAAAGVTGQTEDAMIAERQQTGKTYGAIADDAGKLEEFKNAMLEMKQGVLDQRVTDGTLTQEQADDIMAAMEERAESCDGSGPADGTCSGGGLASRNGNGAGRGADRGMGYGMGRGQGACLNQ